jgi:hypothetical protein
MNTWPNRGGASGGPCGGLEERKSEPKTVRPTRSDSSQQASSNPGAVQYGCNCRNDCGPTARSHGAGHPSERIDTALQSVRDDLPSPDSMADVQRAVRAALAEHGRRRDRGTDTARQRLAQLQGDIGRLVDAVAALGVSPSLRTLKGAGLERRGRRKANRQCQGRAGGTERRNLAGCKHHSCRNCAKRWRMSQAGTTPARCWPSCSARYGRFETAEI